nr:hypothetical protein [Halomonas sp. 1513]
MMSDALHVPANPRTSHTAPEMTECPVCDVALNKKNLSKHVRKVHGEGSSSRSAGSAARGGAAPSLADSYEEQRKKEFVDAQRKPQVGKVNATSWRPADYESEGPRKVKVNKKYYKCWQCGKLLTKASTANHLLKKHGIRPKDPDSAHFWYYDEVIKVQYREKPAVSPLAKKPRKKPEVDWRKEVDRLSMFNQPNRKTKTVTCPVCSATLKATNVKKHFNKVHMELLQVHGRLKQESASVDSSVSAKKKNIEIKPEYEYSEDVFDRAKVYQGGAYGLGKSRKH